MRRLSACGLALALCAGPASACINDVELPNHEREFRSQYRDRTAPAPAPEPEYAPPNYVPVAGAGLALLVGGTVLALFGGRSRG